VQNLAAQARAHYENARRLLEKRAEDSPSDPRYWSSLGVAYAGLGRAPEAIRTATQGVTLLPPEKEAYRGAYALEALARVYVITGDKEGAISQLKKLLAVPSHMSAAVLRLDPRWDPLRGHPGFEELVRAK
jgi:Flp pilus assembly protein TadD